MVKVFRKRPPHHLKNESPDSAIKGKRKPYMYKLEKKGNIFEILHSYVLVARSKLCLFIHGHYDAYSLHPKLV